MLYLNSLGNIDNTPKEALKYLVIRLLPPNFNPYLHPDIHHKPQLSPSRQLLIAAKNGNISFDEFKRCFLDELHTRQDMKKAVKELVQQLQAGKNICLICYEERSEECHRKILADYLKERFGIDYRNIQKRKEEYQQLSLWD